MNRNLNPKVWPQLYALASTGKVKTWQISVTDAEDGTAVIWTTHGYVDGKMQVKPKPIKKGKNIGKANETTPREQAISEAESAYKKKIDKKYITEIPTEDNMPEIYLPMLAKKFDDHKKKVTYPCIVQPKMNGVRCLARKISETEINYTSRKNKSYNATLAHLTPHLLPLMEVGQFFDGEIYLHGWGFQKILRRVKKLRPDTNRLQFWIYDIADPKKKNHERVAEYSAKIPSNHQSLVSVPTGIAHSEADIETFHTQFVREGYEGTIIRNWDALYKFDFRSMDLLKKKDFIDAEFKIVGYEAEVIAEVGEPDRNAIIFVCELPDGSDTFTVRPKGSQEIRIEWYEEAESFIGKDLTVRYQELSEDNVPIFPVGIAVRDYE
jgi:DNA ligase-1